MHSIAPTKDAQLTAGMISQLCEARQAADCPTLEVIAAFMAHPLVSTYAAPDSCFLLARSPFEFGHMRLLLTLLDVATASARVQEIVALAFCTTECLKLDVPCDPEDRTLREALLAEGFALLGLANAQEQYRLTAEGYAVRNAGAGISADRSKVALQ